MKELRASILLVIIALVLSAGCESAPRNYQAIEAYYDYRFTDARAALRAREDAPVDEQVLLDEARLGMAALADGALDEAERALGRTFEWLSTAGLNRDRTVAAVWTHEGVRIWKGEPFEQALLYHEVAVLYALKGDWENVRAASANALFRLRDFGEDQSTEQIAREAAEDDVDLDQAYTAVDTNFALGFLMQAIGSKLSNAGGENAQFNAALNIDPSLEPIVSTLRSGDFNTLLIVDYGKGPTKIAYGPDMALSRFDPQERGGGPLIVSIEGERIAGASAIVDLDQMARDHRWNNLEGIRQAKSAIGDALLVGGFGALAYGSHRDSPEVALAGVGMMLGGLLSKSGAKADTRYLEFAPKAVYVVPLKLDDVSDLLIRIEGDAGSAARIENVKPGSPNDPTVIYLRVHGPDSPAPAWLAAQRPRYGNDCTGVLPADYPWILGGRDVSTPTADVLAAYQRHGYLAGYHLEDLRDLYRAEGILIGEGMKRNPEANTGTRNQSFRHILEGGTGLFTPHPYSLGYKKLMYTAHEPYRPKSDLVRNAAAAIRVNPEWNDVREIGDLLTQRDREEE